MKIIQCKQGDDVWRQARSGLPTASCFDQIITPRTRKPSASQDKYLARLLCEWFLGRPLEDEASAYMDRGREMEAEAVAKYEWDYNDTTTEVGLCLTDDGTAGASPDRLVGDDGLLEVKCPAMTTHMAYMLNPALLREAYYCQVQGELFVTGRKWADLISFNPILPTVRVRCEPDAGFQEALGQALQVFSLGLSAGKRALQEEYNAYRAKVADLERIAAVCAEANAMPFRGPF